jgi:large subunit ribosomal protein L2
MPVKNYNPTSAARRWQTVSTFEEITRSKPEKSLVVRVPEQGGRNNRGKITVRNRDDGRRGVAVEITMPLAQGAAQ